MKRFVVWIARLIRAWQVAYARKWLFLTLSLLVFVGSVLVLAQADLLPNDPWEMAPKVVSTAAMATSTAPSVPVEKTELPMSISIPSLRLTATIANPQTTDVQVLDAWLLKGAVRYPTSAKLGEEGNVVLFGHSSYLPVVKNQAYKTFDDIQKLKQGDRIMISSSSTVYTYAVRTVEKKSANDGTIALSVSGRVLTLATCNSFGTKNDRFVVTADLVESHPRGA